MTLDDFSKLHSLSSLDFLKIDTDGWDQYVVEGGRNVITKFKPFLFILFIEFSGYLLEKAGHSNKSFARLISELGYKTFFLLKEKDRPIKLLKGYKDLLLCLDTHSSSDVFAVPEGKAVIF